MVALAPLGTLHIFPNTLAAERALDTPTGGARAADSHTTFDELMAALLPSPGKPVLTATAQRVVVRDVLFELSGELRALAEDPWGVASAVHALDELRSAGITAQHLAGASMSSQAMQVCELLARYDETLARRGRFDEADRRREAVLTLTRGAVPSWLAQVATVRVEGAATLFGTGLDLLNAFAARGVQVHVRVPWDDARRPVFTWGEALLHAIESRAHPHLHVHTDPRIGTGPLAELREVQFREGTCESAPAHVVQVGNRAEQARRVAVVVLGWLRRGVPAHEIVVATPDIDGVGAEVACELEGRGVAAHRRRGRATLETRAAQLVVRALRMGVHGWLRDDLEALWLDVGEELVTPLGAWNVVRAVGEMRRAGLRSSRVGGYREALLARARRARGGVELAAQSARVLADALDRVLAPVQALPTQGPLSTLAAALGTLVDDLRERHLRTLLSATSSLDWPALRLESASSAQAAAWSSIERLVADVAQAAVTAGTQRAWELDELAGLVEGLCAQGRETAAGTRAGSIAIVPIEDLVETSYRCVALAGMDDESFPRAVPSDAVLTEGVRAELNARLGPRLLQRSAATGRGVIGTYARDQWLWLEALMAARDEIVVCHVTPAGARDLGASELVDELVRSLGKVQPKGATGAIAHIEEPTREDLWDHLAVGLGEGRGR
ncbi:MAG: hypothetical protein AAB426_04225, partial [Myxococcota bacterium]